MRKSDVSYTTVLFKKQPKKDGTFPLKLRITYQRKQKYYGIGLSLTEDSWNKLNKPGNKGNLREFRETVNGVENAAKATIDKLTSNEKEFSFRQFEDAMFSGSNSSIYLFEAYKIHVAALKEAGKVSTAVSTENTLNSLKTFYKNRDVRFVDITPSVLKRYEDWMLVKNKKSETTVSIYLRNLRAMFNRQIAAGLLDSESYPFGRYKYNIPVVNTRDKVIDSDILKKIHGYQPEEFSNIDKGKDLWFFLYQCNGMNVKDMCRLKFSDFKEDHFVFTRAKTEGKTKDSVDIRVVLNDDILRIIEKWGNKNEGSNYVFPFYTGTKVSPEEERRVTQNLVSFINDNMNRIAKKLELDINITTYSARQTFSNVLMNSNAPIKLIAETLGHTSTLTTEKHYLKKMQLEKQKEFTKDLLKFDNK
jgi:integrase